MLIAPQRPLSAPRLLCLRRLWVDGLFYLLWVFVLFVSVFDTLLTVHLQDEMMQSELNPMGRALLYLNSGDVGYLIAAKGIGTILAASIVLILYWRRARLGLAVVAGLALFQLGLLLFLTLR